SRNNRSALNKNRDKSKSNRSGRNSRPTNKNVLKKMRVRRKNNNSGNRPTAPRTKQTADRTSIRRHRYPAHNLRLSEECGFQTIASTHISGRSTTSAYNASF